MKVHLDFRIVISIVDRTTRDAEALNILCGFYGLETRKLIKIHKALHLRDDINYMYPEKE